MRGNIGGAWWFLNRQKKQCGGVYFCVYGIAFSMPTQQKLTPPVLLFSDFAGWDTKVVSNRISKLEFTPVKK